MIDEEVDESEGKVTDTTLVVVQAKKRGLSPAERFKWINPWCILQKSPLRRTAWPGGWSGRMSWCGGDGPSQKIRMLEKSFRFRKVIEWQQATIKILPKADQTQASSNGAVLPLAMSILYLVWLSLAFEHLRGKCSRPRTSGGEVASETRGLWHRWTSVCGGAENNRWIVLIMIVDDQWGQVAGKFWSHT